MTNTQNMQLRHWTFDDATVADCLALAAGPLRGQAGVGFSYTPSISRFCLLEPSVAETAELTDRDAEGNVAKVDLGSAFELRLFGDYFELRWAQANAARGYITVCTDDDAMAALMSNANLAGLKLKPREASAQAHSVCATDHGYLLWGTATGETGDGWTKLSSARIGTICVPFAPSAPASRLVLKAREYFETREAGNVVFIGERLIGFAAAPDEVQSKGGTGEQDISQPL